MISMLTRRRLVDSAIDAAVGFLNENSDADPITIAVLIAHDIIAQTIDPRWSLTQLTGDDPSDQPFRHHRAQGHLYASILAELLVNFWDQPAFPSIADRVWGGQLYPAIAEMEAAKLLARAGNRPEFRVARAGLGTFEMDVRLPSGALAACEVKSRDDGSDILGIRNRLREARSQLPKERAGIVILRMPEKWTFTTDEMRELDRLVHEFLGRTGRIIDVGVFWSEYVDVEESGSARLLRRREIPNRSSRFWDPRDVDLLKPQSAGSEWISLQRLVRETVAGPSDKSRPNSYWAGDRCRKRKGP